ncbi:hypothetical protein ACU8KH_02559 [Lachancea thermotolerans]
MTPGVLYYVTGEKQVAGDRDKPRHVHTLASSSSGSTQFWVFSKIEHHGEAPKTYVILKHEPPPYTRQLPRLVGLEVTVTTQSNTSRDIIKPYEVSTSLLLSTRHPCDQIWIFYMEYVKEETGSYKFVSFTK